MIGAYGGAWAKGRYKEWRANVITERSAKKTKLTQKVIAIEVKKKDPKDVARGLNDIYMEKKKD